MKRCLACGLTHPSPSHRCPGCDAEPSWRDGFIAFSPHIAGNEVGFRPEYFAGLAALEETNFWFQGRNDLILWALRRFAPDLTSFLEIGCGTGYVLSGVARAFPSAHLHGSEVLAEGLAFAAARVPGATFMQMDARNVPYSSEFDVIGAFDVLEHVADDERALDQSHQALVAGGLLLITVPQHAWLWSPVDDHSLHQRRYAAADLHAKIKRAGLEVLLSTSFVTSLLPAMYISRLASKLRPHAVSPSSELRLPSALNAVFEALLRAEVALIRAGARLPWGGSRLVVARKPR